MIFSKTIISLKSNIKQFESQAKNSGWLVFDSIAKNIFNFVSAIFLARYLGPSQYGLLSYSMGFTGMFTSLITLGLDNLSVREISGSSKKEINKILGSSFALKLIGYFVMVLIIITSTLFLKTNAPESGKLIFFLTAGYLFHTIFAIDYFFQANLQSKKTVISNQIGITVGFIFKIFAIYLKLPLIYFAISFILESLLIALSMFFSYQKANSIFNWRIDKKIMRFLLMASLPIIISGLINSFFRRFDQVLIQNILGSTENGYYAVSKKISESIYFIPAAISMSIFPTLVKISKDKKRFESIYMKMSSILFFTSVAIVICVISLSDLLIPMLFGQKFISSALLLKISILAAPFVFLDSLNIRWLLINNKQKYYIVSSLFGLVTTILMNIVLLNKIGVIGAAISYPISWFINSFLIYLLIPQTRRGVILQIKSILLTPRFIKNIKI
ncbi:flippase [Patescibacteria group bacterium]|nr:flippase [Patescibacteria group bacterium]